VKIGFDQPLHRILCISPLFAPTADSEAFCATKMVQALLSCGVSVTVISSHDIRRGGRNDSSRLWGSMRDVVVDVPQLLQPNLPSSIAAASRFQTPFFARWVGQVVETAKRLHRANKFDLVYTRSLPMVAHIAGFWCAKILHLPWVANINDPWEFNFFPGAAFPKISSFKTSAYLFWLRRTLQTADLITYPCKGLQSFHSQLANFNHSAEIIPHIGSRPDESSRSSNHHFRLVHAGKLGTTEVTRRSAKALLLGLKAFIDSSTDRAVRLRLILVGPEDKETQALICDLGLEQNVEHVGMVNYEQSLEYIASSSACVLIESSMDESIFFPSKLADYIVCGKPILAISPSNGIAAELAGHGELLRVGHDPSAVRNAIATLYSDFVGGTLSSRNPSDLLIEELRGPSIANKFLTACQVVTSRLKMRFSTAQFSRPANSRSRLERVL